MIDNDMTNILRNFAGAEEGTGEIVGADGQRKVSTAASEKNAMKSLLEGLDSAQKSVNQMPGTHSMAKNTNTKHPASKFLVGGEFDDDGGTVGRGERVNRPDRVEFDNESWMDKPGSGMLDADIASTIQDKFPEDDMLDIMAWEASAEEYGQPLTVEEYAKWRQYDEAGNIKDTNEDTIAKRKTGSDVHKKQTFKDVFRSMDETEDDMVSRFKKELHDEKTSKALSKGDNGKFNLAEEDSGWGDELIEALKLLVRDATTPNEVVVGVHDLIMQYEDPTLNQDKI